MRIVIDGRIINSSTGRYVERLLYHLEKIDTKNEYIVLVPTKDLSFWTPTNTNIRVEACDYSNFSLGEQTGMRAQLDNLHADLVHFCMPQQPVFYGGDSVTTIHDLTLLRTSPSAKNPFVFRVKQFVGRFVFHRVIRKSKAIITDSEFSKQDIINFDARASGKTFVTLLGTGTSSVEQEPYQLPFSQYLLYVGQQLDHKNLPRLAEAHQKLLATSPDLGLVLAGRLTPEAVAHKQRFEELGYKNIHFTDFITDEQLNWLYANCRVYVFASLMEGFGLPGLEAMEHGAPVASSKATSLPEILGDAAQYFDPYNVDDIASTIQRYLEDETLRTQAIEKGYKQVRLFSWERMAEETVAVYRKAIGDES